MIISFLFLVVQRLQLTMVVSAVKTTELSQLTTQRPTKSLSET